MVLLSNKKPFGRWLTQNRWRKVDHRLKSRPYKLHIGGADDPGMNVIFEKASKPCAKNPEFQSSLVNSLLKAAAAKETPGKGDT